MTLLFLLPRDDRCVSLTHPEVTRLQMASGCLCLCRRECVLSPALCFNLLLSKSLAEPALPEWKCRISWITRTGDYYRMSFLPFRQPSLFSESTIIQVPGKGGGWVDFLRRDRLFWAIPIVIQNIWARLGFEGAIRIHYVTEHLLLMETENC